MTHKSVIALAAASACVLFGGGAFAQETGRVISSTPVIQQVAVPRQVCSPQQVVVPQQKSGAGAAMGALAGGAIGNSIGDGGGRAVATLIGIVGGALLGDRIESGPAPRVDSTQQCTTQNFYENRTVAYNVIYEFAGKQYSVQMPQDPGPFVKLQITPIGAQQSTLGPTSAVEAPAYIAQSTFAPPPTVFYVSPYPDVFVRPTYGVRLHYGHGYTRHGGNYWR